MTDERPVTNGPAPEAMDVQSTADAGAGAGGPADDDREMDRPGREPGELIVALSPRQIFGGFVLLAGAILVLRRRVGRKREG